MQRAIFPLSMCLALGCDATAVTQDLGDFSDAAKVADDAAQSDGLDGATPRDAVARDVVTARDVVPARDVVLRPVDAGMSPLLGGCPMFPPDNLWNRDVSRDAVHPRSGAIIANILDHGDSNLKADFGSSAQYGIPFVVVPATHAMFPVRFTLYGDESDPGPYPVPLDAPIEAGGDHHVLVLQQGTCRLYELYRATRGSNAWSAGAGATFDLRSNATRPERWTSCDQAGLPILPGLVRYDEVMAGEIRHALRVTVEHTRAAWIPPATHWGGEDDEDAPAMGTRLRLRADYDISGLHGASRVIATALKRYGLMVADTGTNWYISGATDRRWTDNDLAQLQDIPGDQFEVVDTGDERTP